MRPVDDKSSGNNDFKFDLHDYWRRFWSKKVLVLTPMLIAALVAGIGVRFLTPVYESTAVIEVVDNQFLTREVEQQIVQTNQRQRDHDRVLLDSIRATITGREFQNMLIRRLALDEFQDMREEADMIRRTEYPHLTTDEILTRRLRELLTAKSRVNMSGPRLFEISFADNNPENSYILADAISTLFVELKEKKELKGLQTAAEFSDEQIAIHQQALAKAEAELEGFQKAVAARESGHGPVNDTNLRRAKNLQQQLIIDIAEARGLVAKVRQNLQGAASIVPDDALFDNDARVNEYKRDLGSRREEQLLTELDSDAQPDADDENQAVLERSRAALQRYLSTFVRQNYPNVAIDYQPLLAEYYYQRARMLALEDKKRRLDRHIADYQDHLALEPEDDRELQRLTKEVETNRDLLQSFIRAKAQTRITEAVEHMDLGLEITVVEQAERPLAPVRPNKMKIIMLAIVFGGVVGAGSFFVTEYMDSSFTSIDDIEEKLDARVLGTIPALAEGPWNKQTSTKRRVVVVAASVVITLLSISAFYFYGKQTQKDSLRLAQVESRNE